VPFEPYRRVLALPGVRALTLLMLLARIPGSATGMVLTLYVVLGLHRGYGAAGLVSAATSAGVAIGSPLMGRLVDRRGLRSMVALTGVTAGLFWSTATLLPYPVLLASALVSGTLQLPMFAAGRQVLAALVPPEQRRAAFSLDSMSVEVSYSLGPAAGVLVATTVSPAAAVLGTGVGLVVAGVALYLLNPPTRSEAELSEPGDRPARRTWLTPGLIGVLVVSGGATLVLSGTDVSLVATLREAGELPLTGVVFASWCLASLAGGFVHGAVHRSLPPGVLMGLLGLLTIPVGAAHAWWLLILALIPAGALCAPTVAATGEAVSRLAPAAMRGEAMGLQGSALTLGGALGAPLAGAVIDRSSPAWGFGVAGCLGVLVALAGGLALRRHPPRAPTPRAPTPGVDHDAVAGQRGRNTPDAPIATTRPS
jgi:MFS family permease